MAGSVGTVYYDVLPNLDRFAASMAAGVGQQKPVKIPVEVDSARAQASLRNVTTGTSRLTTESARLAAAQGRVRVAAAALNETRQKATAGSARLIAAEERYANAIRSVQTVQQAEAKAAANVTRAREAAAAKTAAAAERSAAREQAAAAKAAKAAERATSQQLAARRDTLRSVSTGLVAGGVAAAVAVGGMVKVTADFEEAVSHVASTGDDARASIATLRSEAIKYGADTAFSAREAANAQEELIKANVSVTDTINGGLRGALDLAAAGSLGVADAAGIMGTAMSQFNVPGEQASHVADLLAAAAGKAQGEVGDFAEALKYVGPLAQSAGVSIEETTGVLAEFANQGILGSQAGTSLRGILQALTAPVGAGAQAMKIYGINVRDAAGNFIGLEAVAGELQKRLGGLGKAERDAALARIFGRNSITAATILYEQGAAGVASWTDAVNDAGFAQDVARTKMDNLKGDVEKLGGAFQSAFISTAASSQGGARVAVQAVTGIVDAYQQLPAAGKNAAFIGAGLAAAAAIGAGGVMKVATAVRSAREALDTLGISWKRAGLAAGGIGAAVAVAAVAVGHFAIKQAEAKSRTDDLTQALLSSKGAIDGNIAAMRAKSLEDSGALKAAQDLGISIEDVTQASLGNAAAYERVSLALRRAHEEGDVTANSAAAQSSAYNDNAKSIGAVTDAIRGGSVELRNAQDAYKRQQEAQQAAAGSGTAFVSSLKSQIDGAGQAADAIAEMGDKAAPAAGELQALSTALWGNATAALAAVDAELAYEQALDQTAETAKKNKGKGVSAKNETGRENATALRNEAAASQALIDSYIKQGKSAKTVGDKTAEARAQFIKNATTMTGSAEKAKELADKYGLIPKRVETKVQAQIDAKKQAAITKLQTAIKDFPPSVKSTIDTQIKQGNIKGAQKTVKDYKRSIEQIPKTRDIDVKAKPVGVPKTQATIKRIRGTEVDAKVKPTGVASTQRSINGIKGGSATVNVRQSGVGAVQSAINSIRGTTVNVRVRTKAANADGGTIGPVRRAGGGTVRGYGGPREDNIAGIDRATGVQTSWVSVDEEVINAPQARRNRGLLKTVNAGGEWDLVPRHADGGTAGRKGSGSGSVVSSGPRTLTLNVDMGAILGGLQQFVIDLQDDRDEYTATVGRMG